MGGEPLPGVSPVPSDVAAAKKRAQFAQSVELVQDEQHSQNGTVARAADGGLGEQGPVGLEQLGQGDRHKLLVVLESLDPANILQQQITSPTSGPCSLHQLLASPASLLPQLRTSIINATSSRLASPDTAREAHEAINEFRRTALSLLDELGHRGLARGVKRENGDEEDPLAGPPTKRFMLHRGLAHMDIFTSAASLSDAELAQLVSAEDTDVIEVASRVETDDSAPDMSAPALGAVVSRLRALFPPAEPPEPEPVEMLYYDPYQSFAPSYDSSPSTLSYAQSNSHALSRNRLGRWAADLDSVNTAPLPPPLPTTILTDPPATLELTDMEKDLLREVGVESEALAKGWKSTEHQMKVWEMLRSNGELLTLLMKGQQGRLRKGDELAGLGETEAASRLFVSFTSLLAARPRAPSSSLTAVPSPSALQVAIPTLLASMARDPAYHGTLEPTNQRAVRDSAMVEMDPAVAPMDHLMGGGY